MLVYFPHIPKAGGQTLHKVFFDAFALSGCLRIWNTQFGADISPEEFVSLSASDFESVKAIIGHLPVKNFLENDYARERFELGKVKILSSVREPVSRLISLYNYVSLNERHPRHREVLAMTPIEYLTSTPSNIQSKYLAPSKDATTEDIFNVMQVFPVEDSIPGFVSYITETFNAEVGEISVRNKSTEWAKGSSLFTIEDLPKAALEELRQKNQLDTELYRRACSIQ